jgi:hypothetical protein
MKSSSTNLQAPEKRQTSRIYGNEGDVLGYWSLEFLWCLVLGIWSFA